MKKIISLVLCLLLLLSTTLAFSSCGEVDDIKYIQEKGTLIVGITDFAPMDYKDAAGNWIGFDADLARLFANELGVTVQFVEIEWDNKALELQNRTIDCVWNGMTLTDEVKASMSCSVPYCNNAQMVVVPAAQAGQYQSAQACAGLRFAVEAGSAGKKAAEANGWAFTEVADQATALLEVKNGTCDAAIIDSLMVGAMVGAGTNYADLAGTVKLTTEEYGVGFRQKSDLTEKWNEFYAKIKANGELATVAARYGVQEALIP